MGSSKKSVFRNSALVSGLVSREQLEAAEARVRQANRSAGGALVEISDDLLARQLIATHLLTVYQVDQLKAGRTKLNLGPYIITDWIGQGGMGQVFKAVHRVMGRESAVKVLPVHKTTQESIANFAREIRMQAQLDHPNLVRAYDAGHDGNVHYLVVEYVPGTDLRRLVRTRGPLTMKQAASIVMQAARGLDYAHRCGLIHRDVKPGNLLVTPRGIAKVSDLGLSGFIHEADEDPRAGKIVGTADYLSPEQIINPHEICAASDIYSLGCTLYYAVTGKVPFPGGTKATKARRHVEETPWHPRRFNPELSEEFVEIVADMMEKDPRRRVQTAEEIALRLEPWAGEASPIQAEQMGRSPWMPPPLPLGEDEEETDVADGLNPDSSQESPSQLSQATDALASSGQETTPETPSRPAPPPPALSEPGWSSQSVAIMLAVAIPVSMLLGAAATLVTMLLLR